MLSADLQSSSDASGKASLLSVASSAAPPIRDSLKFIDQDVRDVRAFRAPMVADVISGPGIFTEA